MLGVRLPRDKIATRCPWFHEHSVETDGRSRGGGRDSSTVLLPATSDAMVGAFRCLHAHCATRSTLDVVRALPPSAIDRAARAFPAAYRTVLVLLAKRVVEASNG
jgi:hypothetical protein